MYHIGLALLRIGFGGMMIFGHGWVKVIAFDSRFHSFSDPLGVSNEVSYILAVFAEVLCAGLVVLGLFTRLAVVPLIITMLVAAFMINAGDPWNEKELAMTYAVPFFVLLITGPGKFSLDKLFKIKI